ncbi:protein tyrosine phosphatase family protein [Maricaulis sp. CAU 1757]
MTSTPDDLIVCRHDRVGFAPQPEPAHLDQWAADGVELVINSRTPEETAGLPFDLRQAVTERGMRYIELPLGGVHAPSPAVTDALETALANTTGKIVMHCRSGTRSAHIYAAHLKRCSDSAEDPFDTMNWPGGRDPGLVQALAG